ncbi:MAG: TOBE domain-containing protein, partial [Terrimicrobiaceae bacterium]
VTLGVRPEHLLEGGGGDGELKGEVLVVERLGGATYCYLKLEDGTLLTAEVAGNSHVKVRDQLALGVPQESCHVFDLDGLALEQTERHPLADVGRDRAHSR